MVQVLIMILFMGMRSAGVTDTAGPCLSAYFEKGDDKFVVVLLNSKGMDERWGEIKKLVEWISNKRNVAKEH